MNCPVCNDPMIVLEVEQVEVDHCVTCGGIWLDQGELELLLGNSQEKENFLHSLETADRSGEPVRRCPICRKKMAPVRCAGVLAGKHEEVRIDRCRRGDGLWFDKGELASFLSSADHEGNAAVIHFLKETFGRS